MNSTFSIHNAVESSPGKLFCGSMVACALLVLLGIILCSTGVFARRKANRCGCHGKCSGSATFPTPSLHFRGVPAVHSRSDVRRRSDCAVYGEYTDSPFAPSPSGQITPGGFVDPTHLATLHHRNRSHESAVLCDATPTRMPEPEPFDHSPTYSQFANVRNPRVSVLRTAPLPQMSLSSVHSDEFSILQQPNANMLSESPVALSPQAGSYYEPQVQHDRPSHDSEHFEFNHEDQPPTLLNNSRDPRSPPGNGRAWPLLQWTAQSIKLSPLNLNLGPDGNDCASFPTPFREEVPRPSTGPPVSYVNHPFYTSGLHQEGVGEASASDWRYPGDAESQLGRN